MTNSDISKVTVTSISYGIAKSLKYIEEQASLNSNNIIKIYEVKIEENNKTYLHRWLNKDTDIIKGSLLKLVEYSNGSKYALLMEKYYTKETNDPVLDDSIEARVERERLKRINKNIDYYV